MHLAGRLVHRGAQSEEERHAAEFIRDRFREYTEDTEIDPFYAIDGYHYLFASHYSEFVVVAFLAFWWPLFAAGYGVGIMVLYLAEFMGHRCFSRFMPQFDSQNVVARFLADEPAKTIVVTAHYDSGAASPLTNPEVLPWLRKAHWILLACMAIVIVTCAADAWAGLGGQTTPHLLRLRWMAVLVLGTGALMLFLNAPRNEDVRGANNNASGVAALLRLAEKLSEDPPRGADVWLVATGSHEAWMSGARHLLEAHGLSRYFTHVLNLESVGAGRLHYLTAEGMLHRMAAGKLLVHAAETAAARFDAQAGELRAIPTGAHIPLSWGYPAMTIMGLNEEGLPAHWNWHTDRIMEVDEPAIARAADFAEAVVREAASDSPPTE